MQTLRQNTEAVGCSVYFGQRGDWFIVAAVHRDSEALTRSNYRVAKQSLEALPEVKEWKGEFAPIAEERFHHWAVGWVDYLIIDPACKAAVDFGEHIRARLEDYPVLDDEDYSREEEEEAEQIWRDCYRPKERAEYIRQHPSQFEFCSFADLLGCVRGNYFSGYASELLH